MTMTDPTPEAVADPNAPRMGPPADVPVLAGPNGELISVENVTPERAKELLELNTENYRRQRRSLILKYARDMVIPGGWVFTADKIGVDSNGVLSDGQNRLGAQIRAGVTLPWLIAWNLLPEATRVMDSGAARTAADHLNYLGITNASAAAALARLIIQDRPERRGSAVSTTEVTELIHSNNEAAAQEQVPSLLGIVARVGSLETILKTAPRRTVAYAWWRLAQLDPVRAEAFFMRLNGLNDLAKESPILALNRRLLSIRHEHKTAAGTRMHQEMVAAMFYGWNAWVRGENRSLVRVVTRTDGSIYMPEPLAPPTLEESDPPAIVEQNGLPADRRAAAQGQ
jgi:hypothetical protein